MTDNEVDLGAWKVTQESLQKYLDAVGDAQPGYLELGLAPPLALAAQVVGRLLERLSLPPGAIHSLQEVETRNPVPVGAEVRAAATLERPRRRGDLEFLTVVYSLYNPDDKPLVCGNTTVLLPGGTPAGQRKPHDSTQG